MNCERDVKAAVKAILKDFGIWYFMPSMNGFGRAGVPDFLCCWFGRLIGIETKFGKNTTSAAQDRELAAIIAAGGYSLIVRECDVEHLPKLLNAIKADIEAGALKP